MGALMLRAERCLNCGGPMPVGLRIDAHYCKASCRTLAYRIRKRTGSMAAKPGRSTPKWAQGQTPVIGSALASLADLQARILRVAHQLEQEDQAFRHPHPAAEVDRASAARQAPHGPREIVTLDELSVRHRWQDLVTTLGQAEAALAGAREQVAKSARHLATLGMQWDPLPETATPAKRLAEAASAPVNAPEPADSGEVSLRAAAPITDRQPTVYVKDVPVVEVQANAAQPVEPVENTPAVGVQANTSHRVEQVEDLLRAPVPTTHTPRGELAQNVPRALRAADPKPGDHVGKLLREGAPAKAPQRQDPPEKLLRPADPPQGFPRATTPPSRSPAHPVVQPSAAARQEKQPLRPAPATLPPPTTPSERRAAPATARDLRTFGDPELKPDPVGRQEGESELDKQKEPGHSSNQNLPEQGKQNNDKRAQGTDKGDRAPNRQEPLEYLGQLLRKHQGDRAPDPPRPADFLDRLLRKHQGAKEPDQQEQRDFLGPLFEKRK